MYQTTLTSLLLGAGAGLAVAHPGDLAWFAKDDHSSHHHGHHGHHSAAFSAFPSLSMLASGSGIAAPTGFAAASGSGIAAPTGSGIAALPTGYAAPSGAAGARAVAVKAAGGCSFTDAASAIAGKKGCKAITLNGIKVPAGTTLDMTDLADGTTVTFEGTTTFAYKEWKGPLISVSGSDITVTGAAGHLINMGGDQWWDGEGSNGGKTKPKGFYAHDLKNSVIKGLNIKNTPVQCFSINGATDLQVNDVTIDNTAGNGEKGGHNTDAFDIGSSTGVHITGANVKNQDDCVAINSGSDISFTRGSCSGGHGLSIGSVGGRSDNDVSNVVFSDSTVSNSDNGARIKTISGATGSVKNITYSGITLSGIAKYGIVIEQDYENGSPTGKPTAGVPISDVTLENIKGTVSGGQNAYILCASCSDWTVSGVSITGGKAKKACKGAPSAAASLC